MTPIDMSGAAATPSLLPYAAFFLSYAAVLATPGPNLLAAGGMAALHGLRGATPFCLGIALGAGALGTVTLLLATGATARLDGWQQASRAVGGCLMLLMAADTLRLRPPESAAAQRCSLAGPGAAFGAGFVTAATNPVTGAFFAANFLDASGTLFGQADCAVLLLGVVMMASTFFLTVAALLARPGARSLALSWYRPVRMAMAGLLGLMGLLLLRSALG